MSPCTHVHRPSDP